MSVKARFAEFNTARKMYCDYLESEIDHSRSLISALEGFINIEKGELMGRPWDKSSEKLSDYIEILNKRVYVCNICKNVITAQTSKLISNWYSGFGAEITDESIALAKQRLAEAERVLNMIRAAIADGVVGLESALAAAEEEYARCKELVDKLDNYVGSVIPSAQNSLSQAFENARSQFGSRATSIEPSEVYSFLG